MSGIDSYYLGNGRLRQWSRLRRPSAPDAPGPLVAAGVDFILEGPYAQKRISRTDERGYHGAEPPRRPQRLSLTSRRR